MAVAGSSVADGTDLVLTPLRALGGPPRDAQAAGPTASGARRARGPSLARCHSLPGSRPASTGHPPLLWLSRFPELNVRTYVAYGGRPGIYFFSLDAARLAAVAAARRAYRLPYFHAEMSARHEGETVHHESKRLPSSGPSSELRVSYGPTGPRASARGRVARALAGRSATASTWWSGGERCARTSTIHLGRCSPPRPRSSSTRWPGRSGSSSTPIRSSTTAPARTL